MATVPNIIAAQPAGNVAAALLDQNWAACLVAANNLSDVVTPATALANLGGLASGTQITNSLSGNVALNNTANYFDGPSVAQGGTGTWFASGTVTLEDTGGAANFDCKLWDGTTVIASATTQTPGAGSITTVSLSGVLATPAGNIRISVRDETAVTGLILFNRSGNSKDATVSAFRVA